jgi:hypothetical protein
MKHGLGGVRIVTGDILKPHCLGLRREGRLKDCHFRVWDGFGAGRSAYNAGMEKFIRVAGYDEVRRASHAPA